MYLHLEFTDGSNPHLYRGPHPAETTYADCMRKLSRWQINFNAVSLHHSHGGIYATLERRDEETEA